MAKKYTTETFIVRANKTHNNKYSYSDSEYNGVMEKLKIICPLHGPFEQTPNNHVNLKQGCPTCGGTVALDTDVFVTRAKLLYPNLYNYDKVCYRDYKTKVVITCPIHGDWEVTPSDHLTRDSKCPKCASNSLLGLEEFIKRSNEVHKGIYTYDNSVYVNAISLITITCPTHGDFEQKASAHMEGSGCKLCNGFGFDKNRPAILYYLKMNNEEDVYKIGITNRTVNKRYTKEEQNNFMVLNTYTYENGQDAFEMERNIKEKYKNYRYIGPDLLKKGNTELFTTKITEMEIGAQ